jgi:beta-galactosidase
MENQVSVFVKPPKPSFAQNPKRQSWSKWHWHDVVADWNWPGYENTEFEVNVYSSCESTELFLNGKSLGKKETNRATEFQAAWNVPYQRGELKVVGYRNEKPVSQSMLATAAETKAIKISADRNTIKADNQDLSYITVELTDEKGIRNPKEERLVKFEIEGEGKIVGVGNANPVSTESYRLPQRKAWQGRCLVIVKSTGNAGKIRLTASAEGLTPVQVEIQTGK